MRSTRRCVAETRLKKRQKSNSIGAAGGCSGSEFVGGRERPVQLARPRSSPWDRLARAGSLLLRAGVRAHDRLIAARKAQRERAHIVERHGHHRSQGTGTPAGAPLPDDEAFPAPFAYHVRRHVVLPPHVLTDETEIDYAGLP
jgi:hypothetical protein